MPHIVVEYTANLRPEAALGTLLPKINAYLIAQRTDSGPIFPLGGIRSRAVALDDWCIASGDDAEAAFVHVSVKVGAGRDEATSKRVFDGLFELLKAHFAASYARRGFALSMETATFGEAGTWKHNNLHARISAAAAAAAAAAASVSATAATTAISAPDSAAAPPIFAAAVRAAHPV